jgi:hypothetical protein
MANSQNHSRNNWSYAEYAGPAAVATTTEKAIRLLQQLRPEKQ